MSNANIKEEMRAIDTRNRTWLDSLSEEDYKKVTGSMWIIMRYVSSVESKIQEIDEHYLIMVNEFVNTHFNIMRHHPELQWKLMQLCGIGKSQFHPWIAPGKGAKNKLTKLDKWLLEVYPDLNDDELQLLVTSNTQEDFEQLMRDSGLDDKAIKELFKKGKK